MYTNVVFMTAKHRSVYVGVCIRDLDWTDSKEQDIQNKCNHRSRESKLSFHVGKV